MKKKMSAEERAEFKNGKYMGGPAEEKAEKKKKPKKMAMGGPAERPMGRMMNKPNDNPMAAFNKFDNMPGRRMGQRRIQPGLPPYGQTPAQTGVAYGQAPGALPGGSSGQMSPGIIPGPQAPKTMKTGGLVKGAGCASKGVKAPRMK